MAIKGRIYLSAQDCFLFLFFFFPYFLLYFSAINVFSFSFSSLLSFFSSLSAINVILTLSPLPPSNTAFNGLPCNVWSNTTKNFRLTIPFWRRFPVPAVRAGAWPTEASKTHWRPSLKCIRSTAATRKRK